MKPTDRTQLLRETLADEALESLRTASLQGGLTELRRQRRRRQLKLSFAGTAALALVVALSLLPPRGDRGAKIPVSTGQRAQLPPIEVIDDEQLLALFPTQSVALVGTPGGQELLFLDDAPVRAPH